MAKPLRIDVIRLKQIRQRLHQAKPVKAFYPDNIPKLVVSIDHQYFDDLRYLLRVVEDLCENPPDAGPVAEKKA